jgi:hypothetical protein
MAEVEQIKLSNGDVVEIKPMTMRQAKACNFMKILSKINKAMEKEGNEDGKVGFDLSKADLTEDEILCVVKQYYPKAEELPFIEVFELFSVIIGKAMEKN